MVALKNVEAHLISRKRNNAMKTITKVMAVAGGVITADCISEPRVRKDCADPDYGAAVIGDLPGARVNGGTGRNAAVAAGTGTGAVIGSQVDCYFISFWELIMKTIIRAAGFLLLLLAFTARAASGTAPDALVKTTVDEVLSAIKQSKDKRALHELAEKKVLPHFDFQAMTRLAVGKSWREASPAQQKSLENAFRSLLVSTYTAALSQSTNSNQTVEVKPASVKPDQTDVTVKTLVKEPGRQPIAIDYRMSKTGSDWKVYDVVVENLSLVTNYRGSFNSEISRSGIDGLIKTLEAKNRQLAEG
ncbi:MAG TPA: ABC transporter substrate-binding protein [Burkholderiales bacterium]|nr:ABC transporter substrate-binding protein [Burkholderiales bacterium]